MSFKEIWHTQLFHISGDPITVGSLVLAMAMVVFGFIASRVLSRQAARLLEKRAGLDPGARDAVENLGFYGLFAAIVLTTLNLINFPLTVFTIAGGAVAIGVGFGSQNIMNNFISGLILLFERPDPGRGSGGI